MAFMTFHWTLDLMIFLITLLIIAYTYMTRKFLYWKKRGVMEIPPTAFTGNFTQCLLMKKSPGSFVKELYDKSANLPYMGFYILDRPFFLARDPELIKCMVLRDFNYFTDRYVTAHDGLGAPNIFFINNPGWKLLRTKLTPIFTSGKLKKMFELMLDVGKHLDTYLNSLDLRQGQILEIKDFCAKYATDIIGATAFGLDINSLNNPDAEFRKNGRELFHFNFYRSIEFTSLFFAPQFVKPMGFRLMTQGASDFLRQVFWGTAAEREKTGVKRNDLIDILVDLKKKEANSTEKEIFDFDGDNLVAQAGSFFIAGFETVSTAIGFSMYELALAPEIQTKLREEIRNALDVNNHEITYDLVNSLPYLDMVVAEALRKYPSLPFLDRVTNADYKVPNSDLVLEKGTPVYIPMIGLHYDPQYFPNPEVFDPERFNEENKRNRKPCIYMPFGDGPRACIGMRFGLLETKLALIHILSDYEVLTCDKTLIPMIFEPKSLLIAAKGGLFLKLRKIVTDDKK